MIVFGLVSSRYLKVSVTCPDGVDSNDGVQAVTRLLSKCLFRIAFAHVVSYRETNPWVEHTSGFLF